VNVSPVIARQRLVKKSYCGNEYTRNNRIVGRAIFYAIRVVSKKEDDWFFPELIVF
jgi:hypothetical protein